ncbi:MAG TPA: phosphatase PAP2 family protein [Terracidiphilus sp.]|nr:phosphatase PAP2 family protein [Terracidiphilus sp.]
MPHLTAAHVILLNVPPNCFPSMHTVSALLVLYWLRHWKWGCVVGALHMLLTILATLGLGEHYTIDLLAAVPLCFLAQWLTNMIFEGKLSKIRLAQEQTQET